MHNRQDTAKVSEFPSSFKMLVLDEWYLSFPKILERAAVEENLWCLHKKWSLATWTPILYTRLNYSPNGSSYSTETCKNWHFPPTFLIFLSIFVSFPLIFSGQLHLSTWVKFSGLLTAGPIWDAWAGFYSVCHSRAICEEKNGQFDRNLDNYPAKWPYIEGPLPRFASQLSFILDTFWHQQNLDIYRYFAWPMSMRMLRR